MKLEFRTLRADEIECRIGRIGETSNGKAWLTLLLYKDARCDMTVLDETVGALNWKREHSRENANCTVSIWDEDKKQWIGKEDTGSESNTEAEKGLASDSFKRACVNWGIGRELYTAPLIFINESKGVKFLKKNGKTVCNEKFKVSEIKYDGDRNISGLVIKCGKTVVFDSNQAF